MVHVKLKEMEKAFRNHKNILDSSKYPHNHSTLKMVLFYAVECGLKALYMRRNRLKDTCPVNNLGDGVSGFKHDLNKLLGRLQINIEVPRALTKDKSKQIHSRELHEGWRYGKVFDRVKEAGCVASLQKILNELNKRL
ncbi:MAG: hypothetical protein KAW12_24070 [Candidatus Aminicenantes bacterium]|nr:hypothetical protein [Candidatus Aminicenantes bacterium]